MGRDVCALIEDLPTERAAIRSHSEYRRAFQAIKRARGNVKKLGKARKLLEKRIQSLLTQARKVFQNIHAIG